MAVSSNYISSIISTYRGVKKIAKGDRVAILTTLGETAKVVEKAAKIDTSWGQKAQSIVEGFAKAAEGNPALGFLAKGLKIAKKGDEIGMFMSGIKAVKSEAPPRTLIEESFGWAAKLLSKGLVLNYGSKLCNIKGIKPIADSITKFSKNTKGFGQLNNVIAGIAYSVGTTYGQKYGKKLGSFISDKLHLPTEKNPVPIAVINNKKLSLPLR